MIDLFPKIIVSNQSDHDFIRISSLSELPLFVTADALWEGMESHYGEHHYEVRAYEYVVQTGRYKPVLSYRTTRKYPGIDITGCKRTGLLDHERVEIMKRLSTIPEAPEAK